MKSSRKQLGAICHREDALEAKALLADGLLTSGLPHDLAAVANVAERSDVRRLKPDFIVHNEDSVRINNEFNRGRDSLDVLAVVTIL